MVGERWLLRHSRKRGVTKANTCDREYFDWAFRKSWMLAAVALLGVSPASNLHPAVQAPSTMPADTLSVMTYNVKGLPWPVALGRDEALSSIGDRLLQLRTLGRQPHVVALQEVFSDEAKTIGRRTGYAHVISGPSAGLQGDPPTSASDIAFAAAGRWSKGETEGKFVNSGLQILSDYPVIRVRRAAFPSYACAGFDCLANKGVLLVSIVVPGSAVPVDVVTTHLNSRHSAHVPETRSLYAYRRQLAFLGQFVAANHNPASPLILAGDFNMGPDVPRQTSLLSTIHGLPAMRGVQRIRDGLSSCISADADSIQTSADARWIMHRARDWQFIFNGARTHLHADHAAVPFGRESNGTMLSDHMGFAIGYSFALPKGAGN